MKVEEGGPSACCPQAIQCHTATPGGEGLSRRRTGWLATPGLPMPKGLRHLLGGLCWAGRQGFEWAISLVQLAQPLA